ncbi:Component of a membrane-bound complex containing the Tor2p kinase, partial [Linderina pennispora]
MALVTDPAFLIYQLRISFLRTNDQTAERIITFDDLAMPNAVPAAAAAAAAATRPRRRNTSASELRHHVAVQSTVNPYIVACGYFPETDAVGSPDVRYSGGYVRPQRDMARPAERAVVGRNTNRNAKVAPTREGHEEVVGLGVVPRHAELLGEPEYEPPTRRSIDTVRRRPSPELRDDAGSLSDGDGRRSLDAMVRRGSTIRLQRSRHKGSARDAIALADFDFSTILEESSQETRYLDSVAEKPVSEPPRIRVQASPAERPRRLRKNPSNIELRKRPDVKPPLMPIREGGLKRSATLPTRRANDAKQPQAKWAGNNMRAVQAERPQDTWDASDDDEPSRRGVATKTWYGPRTAARPISLFPPVGNARPMPPPMPLMFGDGDSDDDIDLEGDDGSSKTPAMMAPGGLRGLHASPHTGARSRSGSTGRFDHARQHWPPPKLLAADLLAAEPAQRPRGRSDPEARSWSTDALVPAGASPEVRPRTGSLLVSASRPASTGVFVPTPAPAASGLAALLARGGEVRANPFAEEYGGGGTLELTVFVFGGGPQASELAVRVRPGATVEQAIGHTLYQYVDERRDPVLAPDAQDVVAWALRIAEDGAVDDDFPALDRTRPVAKFAFDQFALCRATPEQERQNEALRVRQGRPPRMARPPSVVVAPTKPTPSRSSDSPRPLLFQLATRSHEPAAVLQLSRVAAASTAGMFVGNAVYAGLPALPAEPPQPSQPRLLKVHVLGEPSSAEALRTTTVNAGGDLPVAQVLSHVCRKWAFSEDDFVLGILDAPGLPALPPDMLVAQIPESAELCLYRADAAPPSLDSLARAREPPQQPPTLYRIFPVVRRAQMFARHERSLVIDGEFVTLMPAGHRTDASKTLTVHVSNITCRRNQRSPRKLKLLINRPTATGDKSLDLEAESEDDALQI